MSRSTLAPLSVTLLILAPFSAGAQVAPRLDGANTWSAQQTFTGLSTSQTGFPLINMSGHGAVGPRNNPVIQVIGTPLSASDQEVNFDSFAYAGYIQYDAERYDANGGAICCGPVAKGETVGVYSFEPFDGKSDANTAQMLAITTQDQSNSAVQHGTALYFSYTPNSTSRLRQTGIAISPGGRGGVTVGWNAKTGVPTDLGEGTLHAQDSVFSGDHFTATAEAYGRPTLSSCGAGPVLSGGSDQAGQVGNGSGTVTSCTLTFAKAWTSQSGSPAAPFCVVQFYGAAPTMAIWIDVRSNTAFTVNFGTSYNGAWTYICMGGP
jgi:hypothetical protein